jgi:hypothetical protein
MASANAQAILAQIPNDFYGGEICTSIGTRHDIHVLQYVDHQYSTNACVTVDTQGTSGLTLKDRWYEQFRCSCNSYPNTIGFQWRRDLHEHQKVLCTGLMIWTVPTAKQFLPEWHVFSMEERIARLSALSTTWLTVDIISMQWRDLTVQQFLPKRHVFSMEERFATSLLLAQQQNSQISTFRSESYFQIWKYTFRSERKL